MASRIDKTGRIYALDGRAEPDDVLTEEDAKDPGKLARLLVAMLRDIAALKRRFWPARIDFEDVAVDSSGTTVYRLNHGFNGRVRWWIVGCSSGSLPSVFEVPAQTTPNTLALSSVVIATVTIRVEAAG